MANKYVSIEEEWSSLKNSASVLSGSLEYGNVKSTFEALEEIEEKIKNNGITHMYSLSDSSFSASIVSRALQAMQETVEATKDIHKNTLASIDSKATELATNALEKLNKVNAGDNVYKSAYITTEDQTEIYDEYGQVHTITTKRPMTADELMTMEYGPLKTLKNEYADALEEYKIKLMAQGELSDEEIEQVQNMKVSALFGYTGEFGEYQKILSDRAQNGQIWETVLDITIGLGSAILAPFTGGASLVVAAAYFVGKAGYGLITDTNLFTGETLTDADKGWLIFDAVTSVFAAGAGLKVLSSGTKTAQAVSKAFKIADITGDAISATINLSGGVYAISQGQWGSGLMMLGVGALGAYSVTGGVKGLNLDYEASAFGPMSLEDGKKYRLWNNYAQNGVSVGDRLKLLDWKYPPKVDLYLKYKSVYDNPKYFSQVTGDVIYPGTNGSRHIDGFLNGKYDIETLSEGMIIDRYGGEGGFYFSPDGATFESRALPPFMDGEVYTRYEVVVPFDVKSGTIAPWFNQPGMGTQFLSEYSVEQLRDLGWIKVLN